MKTVTESNDVILPQNLFGSARRFFGWLCLTDSYLATLSAAEIARKAGQPMNQPPIAHERPAWLVKEEARMNEWLVDAERQAEIRAAKSLAELIGAVAEFRRVYAPRAQPEAAQ